MLMPLARRVHTFTQNRLLGVVVVVGGSGGCIRVGWLIIDAYILYHGAGVAGLGSQITAHHLLHHIDDMPVRALVLGLGHCFLEAVLVPGVQHTTVNSDILL